MERFKLHSLDMFVCRPLSELLDIQKLQGINTPEKGEQQKNALNQVKIAISANAQRFSGHQQHVSV